MSADVQWQIIRNCSSFLVKRKEKAIFTKEPHNLKARNSARYNGLINKKTVGIEPAPDGKGIQMVMKRAHVSRHPNKMYHKILLKKDNRKVLKSICNIMGKGKYRRGLKWAAMRRACALLKSQKPVAPLKKKGGRHSKK